MYADWFFYDDSDSDDDSDDGSDDDSDDDSDTESDKTEDYSVADSESDNESDSDSDRDIAVKSFRFFPSRPHATAEHKRIQHNAWLPLVKFLGELTGLKDLVYACTTQLPKCVLEALHQAHPQCRLHIRTFSLRSLYQEKDQPHDIDPDELALVKSPCLYSIHASCAPYGLDGRVSFNLEAVEHMVSGFTPNLRQVHVYHSCPPNLRALRRQLRDPKPSWKGFPEPGSQDQPGSNPISRPRARLEILVLSGGYAPPNQLSTWHERTDFRYLQRLELAITLSVADLTALTSMAADDTFHSLRTLGLHISSSKPLEHNPATLDKPTSLLLAAMPPLHGLTLTGHFGALTLDALLRRHGPTLRKLAFLPAPINPDKGDEDDDDAPLRPIRRFHLRRSPAPPPVHDTMALAPQLARHCPRLHSLRLRVRRHRGGPAEVAVYRALGQFLVRPGRLARLALVLDCRVPAVYVPPDLGMSLKEEVQVELEAERGWCRDMLGNCAVDGALARAVFEEIVGGAAAAAAGEGQDGAAASLECLRLEPEIPAMDTATQFEDLVRWVGRTWVCKLGGAEPVTKEMKRYDVWGTRSVSFRIRLLETDEWLMKIWDELWPSTGGDWREQWSSLPLRRG
ncbi:hypothetical protein NEMBOFW57_007647 [Staphylotrichum longicolle]|uniref:Uncharacterized protein n=1 Tax=Staphylotrichum longicolle TaxID=669026 RepID=A0AAD4HVB5_9PEZI|nr:hypothetical protein NEMBOFW57_007647 [Staphylotrichum longicolle]